jgi:hypothetical protein
MSIVDLLCCDMAKESAYFGAVADPLRFIHCQSWPDSVVSPFFSIKYHSSRKTFEFPLVFLLLLMMIIIIESYPRPLTD